MPEKEKLKTFGCVLLLITSRCEITYLYVKGKTRMALKALCVILLNNIAWMALNVGWLMLSPLIFFDLAQISLSDPFPVLLMVLSMYVVNISRIKPSIWRVFFYLGGKFDTAAQGNKKLTQVPGQGARCDHLSISTDRSALNILRKCYLFILQLTRISAVFWMFEVLSSLP